MTDLGAFNLGSDTGAGNFREGAGSSAAAFPILWGQERMRELAAHTANVHAPEVKRERELRERMGRYEMAKRELRRAREAASDPTERLDP